MPKICSDIASVPILKFYESHEEDFFYYCLEESEKKKQQQQKEHGWRPAVMEGKRERGKRDFKRHMERSKYFTCVHTNRL